MKRLHWLVLLASFFAVEAGAQTKIRFTLDWVFEGQTSFMHMANYKGWFKEEGLEVQVDVGTTVIARDVGEDLLQIAVCWAGHRRLLSYCALLEYVAWKGRVLPAILGIHRPLLDVFLHFD